MKLFEHLKQSSLFLMNEEDGGACAVSSDAIARVVGGSELPSKNKKKRKKIKIVKMLDESNSFDSSHVTSVLSKIAAVDTSTTDKQVKEFGFSDSNNNIVRVSVAADQADDFKSTLSTLLANYTDNDQSVEVAEILFNLRNKFNIIDVKWPKMVEDEEPVNLSNNSDNSPTDNDNSDNPEIDDVSSGAAVSSPASTDNISSAMDSMLSALIADAEARRQEAVARAAEARAKEADAAARMSAQKMAAEEEVADMEAFYTGQNEEQKEAKKLAKLAKYRHQMRKSQQDLRSTAYRDALNDQDDDDFAGIDTGEDEKDSTTNYRPNTNDDQVDLDPTSTLDNEVKPNENEEQKVHQHSNLLNALMAMRKGGVRV